MIVNKIFFVVLVIASLVRVAYAQQESDIRITDVNIVPNSEISGMVIGLNSSQIDNYRIIVYVKTDMWYIHPFERGGEGRSYAAIRENGKWRIQTVLRTFPADEVRIFLVDANKFMVDGRFNPPLTFSDLENMEGRYITQYAERGKGRL